MPELNGARVNRVLAEVTEDQKTGARHYHCVYRHLAERDCGGPGRLGR
jgi:hypothetical protein